MRRAVIGVVLVVLVVGLGLWTASAVRAALDVREALTAAEEAPAGARPSSGAKKGAVVEPGARSPAPVQGGASRAVVPSPVPVERRVAPSPLDALDRRRELRSQWRENLSEEARKEKREAARERRSDLTPEERELLRIRKETTRALLEAGQVGPPGQLGDAAPLPPEEELLLDEEEP